jgi:hypothetical protein
MIIILLFCIILYYTFLKDNFELYNNSKDEFELLYNPKLNINMLDKYNKYGINILNKRNIKKNINLVKNKIQNINNYTNSILKFANIWNIKYKHLKYICACDGCVQSDIDDIRYHYRILKLFLINIEYLNNIDIKYYDYNINKLVVIYM